MISSPYMLVGPFRGQVPCAEPGQRTVQLYQCSLHSRDIGLEHTVHLHLWNPGEEYHCKTKFCKEDLLLRIVN